MIEEGKKRINEDDLLLSSCKEDQIADLAKVRSEDTRKMWMNMRIKKNMLL